MLSPSGMERSGERQIKIQRESNSKSPWFSLIQTSTEISHDWFSALKRQSMEGGKCFKGNLVNSKKTEIQIIDYIIVLVLNLIKSITI